MSDEILNLRPLHPFKNSSYNFTKNVRYNTVDSKSGVLISAADKGIHLYDLNAYETASENSNQRPDKLINLKNFLKIDSDNEFSWLEFNCDGSYLMCVVLSENGHVNMMKIIDVEKTISETKEILFCQYKPHFECKLNDLKWHPNDRDMFLMVLNETVHLCGTKQNEVVIVNAKPNAFCVSWSPKGKQFSVVMRSEHVGQFVIKQYDSLMTEKRSTELGDVKTEYKVNFELRPIDLCWYSTFNCVVGFRGDTLGNEQFKIFACNFAIKTGKIQVLQDAASSSDCINPNPGPLARLYYHHILDWNMIVLVNNSAENAIIYEYDANNDLQVLSTYCLPIEGNVVGLSCDFTSDRILSTENQESSSYPILLLHMSNADCFGIYLLNSKKKMEKTNIKMKIPHSMSNDEVKSENKQTELSNLSNNTALDTETTNTAKKVTVNLSGDSSKENSDKMGLFGGTTKSNIFTAQNIENQPKPNIFETKNSTSVPNSNFFGQSTLGNTSKSNLFGTKNTENVSQSSIFRTKNTETVSQSNVLGVPNFGGPNKSNTFSISKGDNTNIFVTSNHDNFTTTKFSPIPSAEDSKPHVFKNVPLPSIMNKKSEVADTESKPLNRLSDSHKSQTNQPGAQLLSFEPRSQKENLSVNSTFQKQASGDCEKLDKLASHTKNEMKLEKTTGSQVSKMTKSPNKQDVVRNDVMDDILPEAVMSLEEKIQTMKLNTNNLIKKSKAFFNCNQMKNEIPQMFSDFDTNLRTISKIDASQKSIIDRSKSLFHDIDITLEFTTRFQAALVDSKTKNKHISATPNPLLKKMSLNLDAQWNKVSFHLKDLEEVLDDIETKSSNKSKTQSKTIQLNDVNQTLKSNLKTISIERSKIDLLKEHLNAAPIENDSLLRPRIYKSQIKSGQPEMERHLHFLMLQRDVSNLCCKITDRNVVVNVETKKNIKNPSRYAIPNRKSHGQTSSDSKPSVVIPVTNPLIIGDRNNYKSPNKEITMADIKPTIKPIPSIPTMVQENRNFQTGKPNPSFLPDKETVFSSHKPISSTSNVNPESFPSTSYFSNANFHDNIRPPSHQTMSTESSKSSPSIKVEFHDEKTDVKVSESFSTLSNSSKFTSAFVPQGQKQINSAGTFASSIASSVIFDTGVKSDKSSEDNSKFSLNFQTSNSKTEPVEKTTFSISSTLPQSSSLFKTESPSKLISDSLKYPASINKNNSGINSALKTTNESIKSAENSPNISEAPKTSKPIQTVTSTTKQSGTEQNKSSIGIFSDISNTNQTNSEGLFTSTSLSSRQSGIFGTSKPSTDSQGNVSTTTGQQSELFSTPKTNKISSELFGSNSTNPTTSALFGSPTSSTLQSNGLFATPNISKQSAGLFAPNTPSSQQSGLIATPVALTAPKSGFFGTLTATTAQQSGLFGTPTVISTKQSGLFGTPTITTTQQSGLFGTPTVTTAQQSGLFGTPTVTTTQQSGLFGTPNTNQTSNGLFSNSKNTAAQQSGMFGTTTPNKPNAVLFGNTSTTNQTSSGLFSTPTSTNTQSGIFGATPTDKSITGLFGNSSGTSQSVSGSKLFGSQSATTPQSSIFGSSSTNQPNSSLFGSTNQSGGGLFASQSTAKPESGIFGSSTTNQPNQGLFGNNSPLKPPGGLFSSQPTNLFGSSAASQQNVVLFGSSSTTNQSSGGLFSSQSTTTPQTGPFASPSTNQPGAGLFGNATLTNQSGNSLFGSQTTITSPQSGIFGTTSHKPSAGFFGKNAPAQNSNLFGTSNQTNQSTNLFGSSAESEVGSLFGSSSGSSFISGLGTQSTNTSNIFASSNASPNASSNLFASGNQNNLFNTGTKNIFGTNSPSTPQPSSLFGSKPTFGSSNDSSFGQNSNAPPPGGLFSNSVFGNSQDSQMTFGDMATGSNGNQSSFRMNSNDINGNLFPSATSPSFTQRRM